MPHNARSAKPDPDGFDRRISLDDGASATASRSLRDRAVSELRTRIISGQLPGDRTFSEVVLADELAMSRAPVREALVVLSTLGWVQPVPRTGYRVTAMTLNELHDLFEVRRALQPAAASAAALRAPHTEDAADALNDVVAHLRADKRIDDLVLRRYRFHRRITLLSGNPEFDRALRDVLLRVYRYEPLRAGLQLGEEAELADALVQGVLSGDGTEAGARMAELIDRERRLLLDSIVRSEMIWSTTLVAPRPGTQVREHGTHLEEL